MRHNKHGMRRPLLPSPCPAPCPAPPFSPSRPVQAVELTKAINADNEEHFAATAAAQPGGKLSVVSAGWGWGGGGQSCVW